MKRKKPSKTSANESFASPEIGQIEQLLHFMSEHNLEEFEYSRGDLRIRLEETERAYGIAQRPGRRRLLCQRRGDLRICQVRQARWRLRPKREVTEDLHLVKSPIVGTYYCSPSPGTEPFVKIGGYVDAGQTFASWKR